MSWELMIADQPEWMERAQCQGTDGEAFFPERGGSTRAAKRICRRCEVRSECEAFALGKDIKFGVWGGLSERQRSRMKRRVAG